MPSSSLTTYGTQRYFDGGRYYYYTVPSRIESKSRSETVKTAAHAQRRLRPHIFIPPTPFSASMHTQIIGGHIYQDKWGGFEDGTATELFATLADYNPSVNFPGLRNTALIRARNNLKDQNVNYAQAFAERKQTASLVTDTVLKFAKAIPQLRRGNVKGFADALGFSTKKSFKGVHQTWLETQYGWKPLLSDVHGAMEDLRKRDLDEPQRYRITVRGSAHEVDNGRFDDISDYLNYDTTTIRVSYNVECHRSSRVILVYRLDNGALATAAAKGFTNPAQLAWELVPFSFVADWFVPIGSYLSALDASFGYQFLGGCSTDRFEFSTQTHRVRRPPGTYYPEKPTSGYIQWEGFGHSRMRKGVVRRVYDDNPMPRFPGFKNPFSLTHVGNAIALLGGKVR